MYWYTFVRVIINDRLVLFLHYDTPKDTSQPIAITNKANLYIASTVF